jgi:hypothetical protein
VVLRLLKFELDSEERRHKVMMEAKRTSALEPNLSNYTTIGRLGLWCDEVNLWEAHNSYKNVMNDGPLQCMMNHGGNYSYL